MGAVLTLGCDMIPKINFAMQQNFIPFIRNLTVSNEGDEDISDVKLTIAFDPGFAKTFTYDINAVPAGQSVEISPLRIILSQLPLQLCSKTALKSLRQNTINSWTNGCRIPDRYLEYSKSTLTEIHFPQPMLWTAGTPTVSMM